MGTGRHTPTTGSTARTRATPSIPMAVVTPAAESSTDAATPSDDERPARLALVRALTGVRFRILGWFVLLLIAAIVGSLLVQRAVLDRRLTTETDELLAKEIEGLRNLAADQPTDVRAVFAGFLDSHVPARGESYLTIVDGRVDKTLGDAARAVLAVPGVPRRFADLTSPSRGWLDTDGGRARYLAVPVRVGGDTAGVFVATRVPEESRRAISDALRVGALVSLSVLLLTAILAWAIAGRVLNPVRLVTETARSISETDLRKRIPVENDDEVGELATTFNAMLDRLEAGIDAQRQFVSDAGHELRTPITVIRGHLEVLGDDPKERAETVDLVTDELDRMARMVNDLLLLAKAERPGFLTPDTVHVGELLHEVSMKASALAPRDWRVEGYAANLSVVADRQRLTQALMNMASNAVAHTDEGDTIAFGAEARSGGLHVWVRDTGAGIPVEDQQRIFERFARGRLTRRDPSGSGLGLAIVKAIAEAHGGRVTVDSRPGEGATFTITLPPSPHEVIDLRTTTTT